MNANTIYSCQSNHFDLISAIDKKLMKSPLTWSWHHVKEHQDEKMWTLERWEKINTKCDHRKRLKRKEDQSYSEYVSREVNIQDEMCRLFANLPMRSWKKRPPTREWNIYKYNRIRRKGDLKPPLTEILVKNWHPTKNGAEECGLGCTGNTNAKAPGNHSRWSKRLEEKEPPTGKVMHN